MPVRFVPSDGTQEPKNKQKFPVERVEFEDGQIIPQFVDLTKPNHPSPGARIRGDTKRPIGSVLSAIGNIGIAQVLRPSIAACETRPRANPRALL